jgi:hypothetical protein
MQVMLGIQNVKNEVLNTWLLSAVCSQATSFPEEGFGSCFLEEFFKEWLFSL